MNIANNMVLSTLYVIIVVSKIIRDYHMAFGFRPIYQPELLLLCSHSPKDVPPEPQWNVSIASVWSAVRPSNNPN